MSFFHRQMKGNNVTDDSTPTVGYALETAETMAALGYKLVPIAPGEKYPKGLGRWQEQATDQLARIKQWFEFTDSGVGWAMGRQPNGQFVFAVDVDGEEGWAALFEMIREHGSDTDAWMNTACQNTGGGGGHFVFTAEVEISNSAKQIAPHIDIRGEGGQIVIGPTIHPNGSPYVWTLMPDEQRPLPAPGWLVDLVLSEPEPDVAAKPSSSVMGPAPTRSTTSVVGVDLSPADWVRANWSIAQMLAEAGWVYMESKAEDSYWCRPGKNPRDGHSAVLHGEGPLVVWSTEVAWRLGSDNRDGSLSFSPAQVYAEVYHGGVFSEAMRVVRRDHMPQVSASVPVDEVSVVSAGTGTVSEAEGTSASLNLPDEFWEARDWLVHVRQAANSRLVSPDALLTSVLARFAALVPASLQIPGIVGSNATFDFIGCVVASSSGGKTVANSVAAELVPAVRSDVMFDASPGSGEGLIAAFMGWDVDEKGKKTGDPSYKFGKYKAIHFNVDEGTGLIEQQSRQGTTIVQTLCSAWSGAGLGQLNASLENRRFIPAKQRRVSAVLNIQTGFGHRLLGDDMRNVGLPQRILFTWAHAPLPAETPVWPGPLDVPRIPTIAQTSTISFDKEIVDEVIALRRSVLSGQTILGELEGHTNLVRLKLTGMIALIENRQHATTPDWKLAGAIVATSNKVRQTLIDVRNERIESDIVTQGERQATRELANENAKERRKIATLADKITNLCENEEWAWGKLRKATTSRETRHRFEPAAYMAQARGAVEIFDSDTGERIRGT